MLKKLKSTLLRMLGAAPEPAAAPAAQPEAARRRRTPDAAEREAAPKRERERAPRSGDRPRRDRKPRTPAPEHFDDAPAAAAPAPAPVPEKPAELTIAPEAEGKVRFTDLPIHRDVLFGIQHLGFQYCTPIQAMALPHALNRRDIAGKAQTGTGKTAAFLVSAMTELLNNPRPDRKPGTCRVLVMAPTRELAIQIHKDAEDLAVYTGLNCVVVFGGMDHEKQRRSLNRPIDILIGTPGRLIDYSRGSSLDLSKTEILVIDEADRMLDMGFIPDVKRIVAQLPKRGERQTLLFSATLDESILRLSSGWLVDPVTLESEPEKLVSENIEQLFYSVLREEKLALLLYFLRTVPFDRMLIFGNRKDVNCRLQDDLARYGYNVPLLSGDIPQDKRIKILERFRTGEEKIVIATDVAARGIHVDDVSIVVNYDLPERAEDYVHRIGRTGRAGHLGKAISFLCEYGAYNLPAIEELLGVTFPSTQPDEAMLTLPEPVPGAARPHRSAAGGGDRSRGRRPARGGSRFRAR